MILMEVPSVVPVENGNAIQEETLQQGEDEFGDFRGFELSEPRVHQDFPISQTQLDIRPESEK